MIREFEQEAEEMQPAAKRLRLTPIVADFAKNYSESHPGMSIGGSNGVAQVLRDGGFDVSDRQIRKLKKRGWQLKSVGTVVCKFSTEDVCVILEMALQHPFVTRVQLPILFNERTGRFVSPTHAWQIARSALLYAKCFKSPILSRPHLALRENFHQRLLANMHQVRYIVWTDESYISYNPVPHGQKGFCVTLEDPRRNKPAHKEEKKLMIHGAASLEWGGIAPKIFPINTTMNETVYVNLLNSHYSSWMRTHPAAVWQQDNAPCHVSSSSLSVLKTYRHLAYWPPNSPDFNPVEFVWMSMKKALHARRFRSESDLREGIILEWGIQTLPSVFLSHVNRALDNMDRAKKVGYATVH